MGISNSLYKVTVYFHEDLSLVAQNVTNFEIFPNVLNNFSSMRFQTMDDNIVHTETIVGFPEKIIVEEIHGKYVEIK